MTSSTSHHPVIKAAFFDFMGTCLDWHSSIVDALPSSLSQFQKSELALTWRQAFFDEIASRFKAELPPEDIDETHRRTLAKILKAQPEAVRSCFRSNNISHRSDAEEHAVQAWHSMPPWSDVPAALRALKEDLGLELFVLANGTTRLQLGLVQSSKLDPYFSLLFSSELLGLYKPSPECYQRAMKLVRAAPEECVMVAAHGYDLRAAKAVGMHTIYVQRWTDDVGEDFARIREENDAFLEEDEGMARLAATIQSLPHNSNQNQQKQ